MFLRLIFLVSMVWAVPVVAFYLQPIEVSGSDRDLSRVIAYYSDTVSSRNYSEAELEQEIKHLKLRLLSSRYFLSVEPYLVTKNQDATLTIEVTEAFPYTFGRRLGVRNWNGHGQDYFLGWGDAFSLTAIGRGIGLPHGWGMLRAWTATDFPRDAELSAAWGVRTGFWTLGVEGGTKWRSTYDYTFGGLLATYSYWDDPYLPRSGWAFSANLRHTSLYFQSLESTITGYFPLTTTLSLVNQCGYGRHWGQVNADELYTFWGLSGTKKLALSSQLRFIDPDWNFGLGLIIPYLLLELKNTTTGPESDLLQLHSGYGAGIWAGDPALGYSVTVELKLYQSQRELLLRIGNSL